MVADNLFKVRRIVPSILILIQLYCHVIDGSDARKKTKAELKDIPAMPPLSPPPPQITKSEKSKRSRSTTKLAKPYIASSIAPRLLRVNDVTGHVRTPRVMPIPPRYWNTSPKLSPSLASIGGSPGFSPSPQYGASPPPSYNIDSPQNQALAERTQQGLVQTSNRYKYRDHVLTKEDLFEAARREADKMEKDMKIEWDIDPCSNERDTRLQPEHSAFNPPKNAKVGKSILRPYETDENNRFPTVRRPRKKYAERYVSFPNEETGESEKLPDHKNNVKPVKGDNIQFWNSVLFYEMKMMKDPKDATKELEQFEYRKDKRPQFNVIGMYMENNTSTKTFSEQVCLVEHVAINYIRENSFETVECFLETYLTGFRRGLIHDSFKVLKSFGMRITVRKCFFVMCTNFENGMRYINDKSADIKAALKSQSLVIRQSFVVRIQIHDDMKACFLEPGLEEYVSKRTSPKEVIQDCIDAIYPKGNGPDIADFTDHKVLLIRNFGEFVILNRTDMAIINDALIDSKIAIAKEWTVTFAYTHDRDKFQCQLPLEVDLTAEAIFDECSRQHPKFVPGSSSEGFQLMINDYDIAREGFQTADEMANGAIVLRKVVDALRVKVRITYMGTLDKIIQQQMIIDLYTTPYTIFREHIPQTSIFEKGYFTYITLRDGSKRVSTIEDAMTETTLLYPFCVNRDLSKFTIQIDQKIRVPIRVEITRHDEMFDLRWPVFIEFTHHRVYTVMLTDYIKIQVPNLSITRPNTRIYVLKLDAKEPIEIIDFNDQITNICNDKNICVEIIVKARIPEESKISMKSKPYPADIRKVSPQDSAAGTPSIEATKSPGTKPNKSEKPSPAFESRGTPDGVKASAERPSPGRGERLTESAAEKLSGRLTAKTTPHESSRPSMPSPLQEATVAPKVDNQRGKRLDNAESQASDVRRSRQLAPADKTPTAPAARSIDPKSTPEIRRGRQPGPSEAGPIGPTTTADHNQGKKSQADLTVASQTAKSSKTVKSPAVKPVGQKKT